MSRERLEVLEMHKQQALQWEARCWVHLGQRKMMELSRRTHV